MMKPKSPGLSFRQLTKIFAAGFVGYAVIVLLLSLGAGRFVSDFREEPFGHVDPNIS